MVDRDSLCRSCLHSSKSIDTSPCDYCCPGSIGRWEPKPEPVDDAVEEAFGCPSCVYASTEPDAWPCKVCKGSHWT